jgi:hypothetical protein
MDTFAHFQRTCQAIAGFLELAHGVFQLEPSLVTTESPGALVNNLDRDDWLNSVLLIEQLEVSLAKAIALN